MKKIISLIKKELAFFLNTYLGYLVAVLFAVFANFLFIKDLFLRGDTSMRPFFDLVPWLFLIFIPALTMRVFAQERQNHTLEVLLTLPVDEKAMVIAKFVALLIFCGICLTLTLSLPITLALLGGVALTEVIVSYCGVLLIIASFIAVGMFFSALTKNQIVAYLVTIIVLFFTLVFGGDFFATFIPSSLRELIIYFVPAYHYELFLKGIIDLRALMYFVSFTGLFLFLTTVTLKTRE